MTTTQKPFFVYLDQRNPLHQAIADFYVQPTTVIVSQVSQPNGSEFTRCGYDKVVCKRYILCTVMDYTEKISLYGASTTQNIVAAKNNPTDIDSFIGK
jgi:hypothetical protein